VTAPVIRPMTEITPDGDLRLNLHPGQARAWQSERRFVLALAGSQGGKTSFGPHWLYREYQRCGPGDYLAVTATFPLLKLKMLPEFLRLFEHTLHLGGWHAGDHTFYFHDGKTRVIFGSATHPESLESATAKAAWLDECGQNTFRLESWEAIQRRLALHRGRVFGGTTPYNLGWLKQQWYDRWQAGDRDYDVINFPSTANPAYPKEEAERLQRTLARWKYEMFVLGQMSRPAGLIYEDFRDTYREQGGHLVHAFDIPPHWPRYGGLDFGAVHTARILVAEDPVTGVAYLYNESLSGGKTTAEHAAEALERVRDTNFQTWYGGAKSESQQRMDWTAAGVPVQEPLVADVESGIDSVIARFKARSLFVFDTCSGVRDELGTYGRVLTEDGEVTDKIKDKEQFHRLDGLRYVIPGLAIQAGSFADFQDYDRGFTAPIVQLPRF